MKTITFDETKFKLVPIVETNAMYHAGYERINEALETGTVATCGDVYRAMLEAAPTAWDCGLEYLSKDNQRKRDGALSGMRRV